MDRLEAHKMFFAQLVTASVGVPATERNLIEAFASTPRERFVGDGPWQVFTRGGYIQTPSDDPALLYQDITVALKSEEQTTGVFKKVRNHNGSVSQRLLARDRRRANGRAA